MQKTKACFDLNTRSNFKIVFHDNKPWGQSTDLI